MENTSKNESPGSPTKKIDQGEKNLKLAEVARLIKDNQGHISVSQFENVMQPMFELVPELEAIQKDARLRVSPFLIE